MSPTKGRFSIRSERPRYSARALASCTLIPAGFPFSSIVSKEDRKAPSPPRALLLAFSRDQSASKRIRGGFERAGWSSWRVRGFHVFHVEHGLLLPCEYLSISYRNRAREPSLFRQHPPAKVLRTNYSQAPNPWNVRCALQEHREWYLFTSLRRILFETSLICFSLFHVNTGFPAPLQIMRLHNYPYGSWEFERVSSRLNEDEIGEFRRLAC